MDYSTPAYHPYAEVYRRPLTTPFPQGVALGTTGVPTRSAAARLLDIEHDFPGKLERRAEINRLKSKRRLEAMDYGLLPYNSWSTYLKPSTPARHYYTPQYTLDNPSEHPIVISRYPVRPLRMVQLAPLSVRCIPMPEQNADALTLEMEADDARIQSQQDARRIQSSIWQSEATDRAIKLCKDRNRIRNQLRRIENARLVGPIYSRLGGPDQLGTRQKVLINYHKGAKADAAPHQDSADISKPKREVTKTHEDVVQEAEVHQAEESRRFQPSTFSEDEPRRVEARSPPPEPESEKQTFHRNEEKEKEAEKEKEKEKEMEKEIEKEMEKEKEKKSKKEHKYETPKEKRRREKAEKEAAAQKEEKIVEPESPQIQKECLAPLSLKIKEQTEVTETFVLPKPKAKKEMEPPASPKTKEETNEPTSPLIKEQVFEPMSPKIKEDAELTSPTVKERAFQPQSPEITEEAKPLSLKIKEPTSELTETVLASPKIEERQTPLQSPVVHHEKPKLVTDIEPEIEAVASPVPEPEVEAEAPRVASAVQEPEVEAEAPRVASPVPETEVETEAPRVASPVQEPEPKAEITTEKEPESTEVYDRENEKSIDVSSPLVRDEPPQFERQKSEQAEGLQFKTQSSVEDQTPQFDSQKSVEEATETLSSSEQQNTEVERQISVASPEPSGGISESATNETAPEKDADDQEPQSPTILRRLISNVSNLEGEACDPSEWDAEDAVEVEIPSERKGIILSASDNTIPDRDDHLEADEDAGTEEGTDTVVWANGNHVGSSQLSTERADELSDLSASTNENAEAGSVVTGDNAEETLSANGRPLSVDAESLAADDEQILDEALETTYSMHDRNLEPKVEEPDEETYKYDENVEYRSKSISIEEDE